MSRAYVRAILCLVAGVLGLTASGCSSTEARDPLAGSVTGATPDAARGLLLTMSDLPDFGWVESPETSSTPNASADVSLSPAACAQSTAALAAANQGWENAEHDESVTYVLAGPGGGETELKEEIVRDPTVSPARFLDRVRDVVSDCKDFSAETAGGTITGSTVEVDLGQGPSDYALTQSWSNAAGAAVTKTYIYLVRGDTVAAITLTTNSSTVDAGDLASIVMIASSRLRDAP